MTAPATQTAISELKIHPFRGSKKGMPLAIEPNRDRRPDALIDFLAGNGEWARDRLREHGALLMRGFRVQTAEDFERVARAIDNDLKNEYLGTSPRDAVTSHVFNASELPGYYPIPQHCEMSFVKNHPHRIFFCCLIAPEHGGETPLVDFRRVYTGLDPEVRQRFIDRGIRVVRNYSGPGQQSRLNFFQLKPWPDMFQTTDRKVVEATCEREAFEPSWGAGDHLQLVSHHDAARPHPETGEPVWFNHTLVFHVSAASGEYQHIYARRQDATSFFFWQFARALVTAQRWTTSSDDLPMHCTFDDGEEIPDADMDHVREVVWNNMVIFPWRKGDVVAIDNYSVGHGRLPYSGPRQVVVCWA